MIFFLRREQSDKCWAFMIHDMDEAAYNDLTDCDEFIDELVGNAEEHGVLDCCGHGLPGGNEIVFTGYQSYEQTPKRLRKLIHVFREWFISKGYSCADVYEFKSEEAMTAAYSTSHGQPIKDVVTAPKGKPVIIEADLSNCEPWDGDVPWCEPCKSWHMKPTSEAHHKALKCFAPWKEPN